jgi:hypothetical protein
VADPNCIPRHFLDLCSVIHAAIVGKIWKSGENHLCFILSASYRMAHSKKSGCSVFSAEQLQKLCHCIWALCTSIRRRGSQLEHGQKSAIGSDKPSNCEISVERIRHFPTGMRLDIVLGDQPLHRLDSPKDGRFHPKECLVVPSSINSQVRSTSHKGVFDVGTLQAIITVNWKTYF